MTKDIMMPMLTDGMKEGLLASWLVEKGQSFKKGDVLFEIETDKVVSEVEATEDGVLTDVLFESGTVVNVGEIVGKISCELQ